MMELRIIRPPISEEERYIQLQLRELQRAYEEAAKPYIERLVHIRSVEIPRYEVLLQQHERIVIEAAAARSLIGTDPEPKGGVL